MNQFKINSRIGDIVAQMPKASDVFKHYQIDFCCGGHRLLGDVLKELNLDEKEVLQALEQAYEVTQKLKDVVDYRSMSRTDLIDYIVNTHHAFARSVLPVISEYATKIMRVHGSGHGELFTVHKLFHALKADLEQHFIKEEEILFPLIKQYDANPSEALFDHIHHVMVETESEHEEAGDVLKELRLVTDQYRLPEDGCRTYQITFEKLQELESDLFQHIHLENNILFKEFEK
jgi:regulator of cell morphogenesis and NO signaling